MGSTIGFVGVEKLREYAFNIFDRRLGSGSN
ncbi:MAG: phage holin family protein [Plesiomonas sp.]